jgi:NAD(P)-dependent dehydrogenase (short-subunit alcohol dehydrogenase family)
MWAIALPPLKTTCRTGRPSSGFGTHILEQLGVPRIIVNIASGAGRIGSLGEMVYAGAKGGVIAFTKYLACTARDHRQLRVLCSDRHPNVS